MELYSGAPYWLLMDGLGTVVPPLERDLRCDAAVIGGGITGALVADRLVSEGLDVAVIDRRDLGRGSTAASTALLQYDLDVPLCDLGERIGAARARRAYALGVVAIDELAEICGGLGCGFERRPSLHFCRTEENADELRRELRGRREAGLPGEWVPAADLRARWGMNAAGAIQTTTSAQIDPYRVCHRLLARCLERGGHVHDRTAVTEVNESGDAVTVRTDRGATVTARYVVHATGYESVPALPDGLVKLQSTYALISEPTAPPHGLWRDRGMMWEYADPYLYLRWVGDRIMVGGEDEPFSDARRRDELIEVKAAALARKVRQLMPALGFEPAFAWTGTFGATGDGLGYIGPMKEGSRSLFALGFGGNGTTCGVTAARLLADRILGRANPDAEIYRFDR